MYGNDNRYPFEPEFDDMNTPPESEHSYTPGYYDGGLPDNGAPPKKPKKKRSKMPLAVICTALCTAIITSACCLGLYARYDKKSNASAGSGSGGSGSTVTAKQVTITGETDSLVEAVYEKCGDSVVGISTSAAAQSFFGGNTESELGEGSGVIYSKDGYIITNYHVISTALEYQKYTINVYFPQDPDAAVPASVVGYNVSGDLAVLKVDKTGLPAMEIGKSKDVKIGQYVVAIGCPGGIEFMGSVSYGIISGLNREISVDKGTTMTLIQTDAAINPGNSGGALLNSKGQLIGVNSVKFVDESFEGMGFAIPADTVVEICDKIIARQNEPSPYIGISIAERYDENTLAFLGYPAGAVVSSVDSDSPAAESGLRRGDIITRFADKEVTGATSLTNILNDLSPKQTVKLRYYRGGRYYDANITIGANNARN